MSHTFRSAALQCFVTVCASAVALVAGAAEADKTKYGIANPLGELFAATAGVDPAQSRLVIYRAPSSTATGIVSLYLEDKYHVALQPNAFSLVCLENDRADIRTRLTQPDTDQPPAPDTRFSLPLKKANPYFVRVTSQADGRTALELVPNRIAIDELKGARQQMHTLSRAPAVRACNAVQPKTEAAASINVITFGVDAAFRDKKGDLQAVTAEGKHALQQVLDKINKKYVDAAQVQVHLIGYADDISDETANQRLALARAQAVQSYFLQNGIRTQELSLEGRGSQDTARSANPNSSKKKVDIEVTVTIN